MKRNLIIKASMLLLLLAIIVVSLSFTSAERKHLYYSGIEVRFEENYHYVSDAEIIRLVNKHFGITDSTRLDTLNTELIEKKIENLAWVKNAEVFKGYANHDSLNYTGGIKIRIEQELPVLRVVDGANGYYVNETGKQLPLSDYHTGNVLVFTGHISQELLASQLLPLVKYLRNDPFLSALIQQIDVRSNGELIMIPRIGEHQILFGDAANIETKFSNLVAVYKNGFASKGWDRYHTINLKFNNQVVCTLK